MGRDLDAQVDSGASRWCGDQRPKALPPTSAGANTPEENVFRLPARLVPGSGGIPLFVRAIMRAVRTPHKAGHRRDGQVVEDDEIGAERTAPRSARRSASAHVPADETVLAGTDQNCLIETRDLLDRLERAMLELPKERREIFIARRFAGSRPTWSGIPMPGNSARGCRPCAGRCRPTAITRSPRR